MCVDDQSHQLIMPNAQEQRASKKSREREREKKRERDRKRERERVQEKRREIFTRWKGKSVNKKEGEKRRQ